MPTQETQTAGVANEIIAVEQQLVGIQAQIAGISTLWTNLGAANQLNAFPTAPLTSTGGLGTADVSPNTAHPIDTRVAIGSELSRAISANNIASMLTHIQGVQSCINGTAVSSNGAAASLLALVQGG